MNEITGEEQKSARYSRDIITVVKEEFNKNINSMEASVIGKWFSINIKPNITKALKI